MNKLDIFEAHRPLLLAIGYRMLGSLSEAEDMVQETFLRWHQSVSEMPRSPKAYLSTILTRLCIDHLRSARREREQYVGSWLPEPVATQTDANPDVMAELADSLSIAFLVMLEQLSPTERAVLLLHDVFDFDYDEISKMVDKSVTNCRQILRRAHQHLGMERPRNSLDRAQQNRLVEQFLQAWTAGDLEGLLALVTEKVIVWSDGGGKAVAAQRPIRGNQKVARFLLAVRRNKHMPKDVVPRLVEINGQAGIVLCVADRPYSVLGFRFSAGRIEEIFSVLNPEKLRSIDQNVPMLRKRLGKKFS